MSVVDKESVRELIQINGFGVLHFENGELDPPKQRTDGLWPIVINHDSKVLSFRFDDGLRPDVLRAFADLLEE